MMSWIRVLLGTGLALAVACGGGGSDAPSGENGDEPQPQALLDEIDCLAQGLEEARRALFGLIALHDRIQDPGFAPPAPNSVTLDLEADPDSFDVEWDVDGDGSTAEVRLFGELFPDQDLADGLDLGESVGIEWNLEVDGVAAGAGDYRVTLAGSNRLRIVGSATFEGGGCKFEIVSVDATLANIDLPDATPEGFLNFRTNDGVMLGLLTYQPPGRVASVSVSFEDGILEFDFDLDTGEAIFD